MISVVVLSTAHKTRFWLINGLPNSYGWMIVYCCLLFNTNNGLTDRKDDNINLQIIKSVLAKNFFKTNSHRP